MKRKLTNTLLAIVIALGIFAIASPSQAYYRYYYSNAYGNDLRCGWQPAHWVGHRWYPARQVCWRAGYNAPHYRYCGWVPARWVHGYYYPAHRACWY